MPEIWRFLVLKFQTIHNSCKKSLVWGAGLWYNTLVKKERVKMKTNAKDCSWFDSQNARLIILCATLGIFGAHKFAQHKNFQGFIYILLDLTLFGIILTFILSWFDLVFLTAKSDNRPGNMILGSMFILLESFVLIPESSSVIIRNVGIDNEKQEIVVPASEHKDKDIVIVYSEDGIDPSMFTIENGQTPDKITVEKDAVAVADENSEKVAEPIQESESGVVEFPAVQNVETVPAEPVEKVVEPVKPKPVSKPKKKQQHAKAEEIKADASKDVDGDDFGSFSLYDMISGS